MQYSLTCVGLNNDKQYNGNIRKQRQTEAADHRGNAAGDYKAGGGD